MIIRKIEICNFRSIEKLVWQPTGGINCLIGPGDSGKSTVLDAIDWCLGARRNIPITDADFYRMDVSQPIVIDITLGELEDNLKSIDTYGLYLRAFLDDGTIEDEPREDAETVLTARLTIADDLDPQWFLYSDRAHEQGMSRNLSWADRLRNAPTRIGSYASNHFTLNKTSILNRLTDETIDNSAALADASRTARESFGDSAQEQLKATLSIVQSEADVLGVDYGGEINALMDAHAVSFSGGNISLHDGDRVPLKKLGVGSSRLLVAGLQRRRAEDCPVLLADEVETGLEPHRLARFLTILGSKDEVPKTQVFMTTHSPVALRELNGSQVFVVRQDGDEHSIMMIGDAADMQGTLRHSPEAFLGKHVLVCEGATEVGLIRGMDLFNSNIGQPIFMASGGVLVDAGGVSRIYSRAKAFQKLKYNVAVLRDDDVRPKKEDEKAFLKAGGQVFKWSDEYSIEDEVFVCLSEDAVQELVEFAISVHGEDLVKKHIESAVKGPVDLDDWRGELSDEQEDIVTEAAKHGGWLKRISIMEEATRKVIAPNLKDAHEDLSNVIESIYSWADG